MAQLLLPAGAWLMAAVAACAGGSDTGEPASGATTSTGAGGSCACAPPLICDPVTSACVECLPGGAECGAGQYCDEGNACAEGCDASDDCAAPTVCNTTSHACVDCVANEDCELGNKCQGGQCVPGCSTPLDCGGTEQCCAETCVELGTSLEHCGECGNACPSVANATIACEAGACAFKGCLAGFADCNVDAIDGCEWDLMAKGPCSCTPGETKSCYDGPVGTEGVGLCKAGTTTCNATGTAWMPCSGQGLPTFDSCSDMLDNDCSGKADDPKDQDGDGWTVCDGDCCDTGNDCTLPKLVNPGAFEVAGNQVDDDCDGTKDNALSLCDGNLASNSASGADYAKAIDLCQTTAEDAPLSQKKWGVIGASFHLADGKDTPAADSRSIRAGFGNVVLPKLGQALAALSTGNAAAQAAPNNASPSYAAFQGGTVMGTKSGVPADWLAANGGVFPNAPGCPKPQGGTTTHDPMLLKLRIRVPTNAKSFSLSSYLYSSEYPEWVCSPFNDFFLSLLDSAFVPGVGQLPNPADKNLAVYKAPDNSLYPLGVNLAYGNTGLFKQCKNGQTGCAGGAMPGNAKTCASTAELAGTGFDVVKPPSQFAMDPGWCGKNDLAGGGTGWLTVNGNVKHGEVIELRFVLWDTGDGYYDSLVLLDNFAWSVDASEPGVHN